VQPPDRFVILAPAELDPGMVVQAPPDRDAAMVFNPETGRRGPEPIAPTPGGLRYGPVPDPGLGPEQGVPSPRPPVNPGPPPR
jgi:hypothetical protein